MDIYIVSVISPSESIFNHSVTQHIKKETEPNSQSKLYHEHEKKGICYCLLGTTLGVYNSLEKAETLGLNALQKYIQEESEEFDEFEDVDDFDDEEDVEDEPEGDIQADPEKQGNVRQLKPVTNHRLIIEQVRLE